MPRKPASLVAVQQDAAGRYEIKKLRCNLLSSLHITPIGPDSTYYKYLLSGRSYRNLQAKGIAESVGFGQCGIGPMAELVTSASAFALAKRHLDEYAQTGDKEQLDAYTKLEAVRAKSLRAAYELAAIEAKAREIAEEKRRAQNEIAGTIEHHEKEPWE